MAGAFDPDAFIGNGQSTAPAFDPDAFLGVQQKSPAQTQPAQQPTLTQDALKSAPGGLLQGFVNFLNSGGQPEMDMMAGGAGPQGPTDTEAKQLVEQNVLPKSVADVTAYQPQTWAGRLSSGAGEVAGNPASYFGPGGPLRSLYSSALASLWGAGASKGAAALGLSPEVQDLAGFAGGALAPTRGGSVRNFEGNLLGPRELQAAGGRNFQAFRDSDVLGDPTQFARWSDSQKAMLDLTNADHAPVLRQLDNLTNRPTVDDRFVGDRRNVPAQPVTALDIDNARLRLGEIARQTSEGRPTPAAAAATRVLGSLNENMPNMLIPGHGDIQTAVQNWNSGRANYSSAIQGGKVQMVMNDTAARNANQNSAMNLGRLLGGKLLTKFGADDTGALNNVKRNGLSPEAEELLNQAITPDPMTQQLNNFSNRKGGGGGIAGTLMTTGLAGLGGMLGAHMGSPEAGMAVGYGLGEASRKLAEKARTLANARRWQSAEAVRDSILSGAPANADRMAPFNVNWPQLQAALAAKRLINGGLGYQAGNPQ